MNTLRKLELGGGILIAAIGTYLGLSYIYLDKRASEHQGLEFPVGRTVFLFFVIDVLPGLAVFFGSYLHSVKRKQAGQLLLILGSLVNIAIFLLLLIRVPFVPYGRLELFWLSFFSATLGILTSVVSFLVQREE